MIIDKWKEILTENYKKQTISVGNYKMIFEGNPFYKEVEIIKGQQTIGYLMIEFCTSIFDCMVYLKNKFNEDLHLLLMGAATAKLDNTAFFTWKDIAKFFESFREQE